ncbi:hypothetical protein Dimus_028753 [Dionaea muscipula]
MGEAFFDLMELMKSPAIVETFVDILLCAVPIWLAVMIGLVIGWSWRPRWTGLVFIGLRSKFRFLWTVPPGFGARRLWLAFTALSAFSVIRTVLANFVRGKENEGSGDSKPTVSSPVSSGDDAGRDIFYTSHGSVEGDAYFVTENDLHHLLHLVEAKDAEITWQSMMERSTASMNYQAWRHDPENGPTVYRSRTVFEDATAELVRDFFWDDEFRPKWDPMLTYFKILEACPRTGQLVVHWIKKFPFFCSDREYIIGRRIWEAGKAYYCITKGVPYPSFPKREKPRRVEHYFSSWVIKPVESRHGQLPACEVLLVHYEDMGIPKDVAKLGVRHGMWGTVKKLHAGMRAYQNERKSEASLSSSALMARVTTKISFDGGPLAVVGASGEEEEEMGGGVVDAGKHRRHSNDWNWKWVVIGGAVAVACGLHTGVIGRALLIGAGRRLRRR